MADKEVTYLEQRAAAEARMAQRAKCPAAIKAHHDMSRAYHESAAVLRRQLSPS
jgi:hypothetical protein